MSQLHLPQDQQYHLVVQASKSLQSLQIPAHDTSQAHTYVPNGKKLFVIPQHVYIYSILSIQLEKCS